MPIPSRKAWNELSKIVHFFRANPEYARLGNFVETQFAGEELGTESDYNGPFAVTEDVDRYGAVNVEGGFLLAGTESLAVPTTSITLDMTQAAPYSIYVYAECYKLSDVAGWTCNLLTSIIPPTQDDIVSGGTSIAVQRHTLNKITINAGVDAGDPNVIEELSQWWQMGDLRIIDRLVL